MTQGRGLLWWRVVGPIMLGIFCSECSEKMLGKLSDETLIKQNAAIMWDYCLRTYLPGYFGKLSIEISHDRRRTRARGGVLVDKKAKTFTPHILIAMNCFEGKHFPSKKVRFTEYPEIHRDPFIGSLKRGRKRAIIATVAHEVAHATEWTREYAGFEATDTTGIQGFSCHSPEWIMVYHDLRTQFVNNV